MSTRRLTVTRAVRTAVGLVGVAAAVATIVLAGRFELPDIGTEPASVTVEPVAADQARVCAGDVVELGQDAAAATAATTVAQSSIAAGNGAGAGATASTLAAPDDAAGRPGPTLLSAEPSTGGSTLAGAQSQRVDLERLSGLAASACTEPTAESWLVGGSTDVGQTTVVSLSNPSTVDASVTLEVYGESGLVDAAGASGIIVTAGSQRIVSLAGLALNVVVPVVHVSSVGAPVAATLQQSAVRSITPEGVEVVGSSAAPAESQIIPGFVVPTERPVDRADGYDYRVPGVRLLAPGGFDGEVSVVARTADGTASEPYVARATAGSVIDVPLEGLPAGDYSLIVTADEPVVAAAHSTATTEGGDDFAWFASTTPLDDGATVAAAPGPDSTIALVNPTVEDRTVTVVTRGAEKAVVVPAGGAVRTDLSSASVYDLSGAEGMHASVTVLGDVGFTSYTVAPPSAASDPVVVRTR